MLKFSKNKNNSKINKKNKTLQKFKQQISCISQVQ